MSGWRAAPHCGEPLSGRLRLARTATRCSGPTVRHEGIVPTARSRIAASAPGRPLGLPESGRARSPGIALLLLLAHLLSGCVARHKPSEEVEVPLRLETDRQQAGRIVFMRECQRCHPGGEAGLAPALNNKSLPRTAVALQVRQGLGAMPAFGPDRIPDDSLGALIDYVELLRRHAGRAPRMEAPAPRDESAPASPPNPID